MPTPLLAGEHEQLSVDGKQLGDGLLEAAGGIDSRADRVDPLGGNGSTSREVRELLNLTPNQIGIFSISRDNRRIYLGLSVTEADIWLMNLR
ncbi:MAG: hypothetical protein NTW28_26845 [Candidatus Solibacter sp.]|nr:hypothetical protein [Candidatus Solibacter sp.]